jgi:hypothetical protein
MKRVKHPEKRWPTRPTAGRRCHRSASDRRRCPCNRCPGRERPQTVAAIAFGRASAGSTASGKPLPKCARELRERFPARHAEVLCRRRGSARRRPTRGRVPRRQEARRRSAHSKRDPMRLSSSRPSPMVPSPDSRNAGTQSRLRFFLVGNRARGRRHKCATHARGTHYPVRPSNGDPPYPHCYPHWVRSSAPMRRLRGYK